MSNAKTIARAQNRLAQTTSQIMKQNIKFAISIEGWVKTNKHDWRKNLLQCFAWACLKRQNSKDIISETRSGIFILLNIENKAIIEDKKELGLMQDKYFLQFNRDTLENVKGEGSTIYPLTFGAVFRSQ